MPIIGAFMGGDLGQIAAGFGIADLTWVTSDGQNMEGATITLTGPQTYTFNTDSNGHVQGVMVVGEYIATVTHEGKYGGDSAKTIVIKNREVTSAIWFAQKKTGYTVVFTSPSGYSGVTYSISNGSGVVYSGDAWTTNMSFILDDFEEYTLSLTIFGDTLTHDFVVSGNVTIDLSNYFCRLIASNSAGLSVGSITYNGYSASSSGTVYVIKTGESRVVKFGCGSKYSGVSTSDVATFNDETVVPSSDSINLSLTAVGVVVTIISSGSLNVPISGTYHTLVIGGGGGGGNQYYYSGRKYVAGGGGGSGNVADSNLNLTAGAYTITIGSGGSAGSAGSASSFGTKLSASGGSSGGGAHTENGLGGAGGSGGGGGGYRYGSKGGAGSYGGGGGGGAVASSGKADGGSGGTYGGAGGSSVNYDDTSDYTPAGSGIRKSEEFYGGGKYDASGGSPGSNYRAGGGGGGGLSANGGRGGAGYGTAGASEGEAAGGGGGGGIAGGYGGDGGAYSPSATQINPGEGGYGYGAGGGGGGLYDNTAYKYKLGGGGGGGGLSSTKLNTDGSGENGGAGAKGAVRIQWVG